MNLLTEFEQQFAVITADITSKTSLLLNKDQLPQDTWLKYKGEARTLIHEANDLLSHMELEVREAPQDQRERLKTRVKSYETELKRLEAEFERAIKVASPSEVSLRNELLDGGDSEVVFNLGEEQKQRLLSNADSLERTSERLKQSQRAALDSEHVGAQVLNDLHHQRQVLNRARDRLRNTDDELNQSSRVLNSMMRTAMQNKFILGVIMVIVVIVIVGALYWKLS